MSLLACESVVKRLGKPVEAVPRSLLPLPSGPNRLAQLERHFHRRGLETGRPAEVIFTKRQPTAPKSLFSRAFLPLEPHYSQRNTFAESAVQIANTTTNAMTSPI